MSAEQVEVQVPDYRIAPEFLREGGELYSPEEFDALPYQLAATETDLPALFYATKKRFQERFQANAQEALQSPAWGTDFPSILDMDPEGKMFDPLLGGVNCDFYPSKFKNPAIKAFFLGYDGTRVDPVRKTLRGTNYFAGMNAALPVAEKFKIMAADYLQAGRAVAYLDPEEVIATSPEDYKGLLAIHDYYANAAITALHAHTFKERAGEVNDDPYYQETRSLLMFEAVHAYRRYLNLLLGRKTVDPQMEDNHIANTAIHIRDLAGMNIDRRHIPVPELNHPLASLFTADNALRKFGHPDRIYALPSGGTMIGVAVQLLDEYRFPTEPRAELVYTPDSQHSDKYLDNTTATPDEALARIAHGEKGAKRDFTAMVCDDNANTLATFTKLERHLLAAGAKKVHPVIAEIDVQRAMLKQGKWAEYARPRTVANFVRLADVASSISPVTRGRPNDRQLRRRVISRNTYNGYRRIGELTEDDFIAPRQTIDAEGNVQIDATVPYNDYMQWLYREGKLGTRLEAGIVEETMARRVPVRLHEFNTYKKEIVRNNGRVCIRVNPETIQSLDYLLYLLIPKGFQNPVSVTIDGEIDEGLLQSVLQRCNDTVPGIDISFTY